MRSPSLGVFASPSKCFRIFLVAAIALTLLAQFASAQQTLGAINGTVTDASGAVVQGATVKAHAVATNLEVTAQTKGDGSFSLSNLPIGTYEVTFTKDGFQSAVYPQIIVQGNRTSTVNSKLTPGTVSSTVTVNATPLMNETDTTTGYTLGALQIDNVPLATGSFTQLAILSPGVNADFLNSSGTNGGFGNQAIWANGQRDTSNSFAFNGVSANNIFNGKSTSQVSSSRVAVNIGQSGNDTNNPSGEIATSTSVYGAIGQALPSPPPETIEEVHVNSAMYDASQGSNSGAHIEITTKSGTNAFHGGIYDYYQTSQWNGSPWFLSQAQLQSGGLAGKPSMHRDVFGGFLGGPIKKDKLFFFASYQGTRVGDNLLGLSLVAVPPDLTSDRSAAGLATMANTDFGGTPCARGTRACTASDIDPVALSLMNKQAPGGGFYIPNAATTGLSNLQNLSADAAVQGPGSKFTADQVNGNIDYFFSAKDRMAAKYYFQTNPNTTPFANSQLLGFPQTMQAGSQAISIDNTTSVTPNLTWEQRIGFIRERAYATTSQFMQPADVGMSLLGFNLFPQVNIRNADNVTFTGLSVGPTNNFANAGIFQNNYEAASSMQWVHGKQSLAVGFNFDYTQLNVINRNNEVARVTFADFPGFLQGEVCGPNTFSCGGQDASQILNGATSRYYRSRQLGAYAQDNIKLTQNLTLNIGVRWDWDGPLTEKNGRLANFYAKDYSYDIPSDTVTNIGLVIAGNNKDFPTKGVSNSTLTGRQWGFAPRIGLVYSPSFVKNVVVRAGFGMYYDRGEFFTELSSPAGGGISGPFGVTVSEPFVVPYYAVGGFAAPFGTAAPPPPPSDLSGVQSLVPNVAQLFGQTTTYCVNTGQSGCGPFFFGGYDPKNSLPYSENWTLDLQWQPINTLVLSMGYVGNHGVHLVLPLPFNQAQIATPQSPLLAAGPFPQNYSYGYSVPGVVAENPQALTDGFPTGNASVRAPYIGYDPNSVFNRAIGISNYDALQFSLNKRFSHGLFLTAAYTYSHTLDEQSALGLFFSGNDPNNPRSSYGNSDFDRTHVFTVSYHYEFPTIPSAHGFVGQMVNGWGLGGVTVLESGQPYSVFDFSGGAASIYWGGGQDAITNPIVPVGGVGSTSTKAVLQGTTGVNAHNPVLNINAFGVPPLFAPGTNGVPPCDSSSGTLTCDSYENGYASGGRNIFRASFQNRFDFGIFKNFKIRERYILRYDFNAFNLFNHPSFDVPNNDVRFNPFFGNPPVYGFPGFPACVPSTGAYNCPPEGNLGLIQHTLGSPRILQMALHLTF